MSVTSTYRGLEGLEEDFRDSVHNWMTETVVVDGNRKLVKELVFITETTRSAERQAYLYNKGLSYLTGKAGSLSKHQEGLAVDIAFNGNALYPSDMKLWRSVADAAKLHGIDWGYDLWKWDKPHFQKGNYIKPPQSYMEQELSDWQRKAVRWAITNKVSNGERPLEPITRVEVMEMLRKFSESFPS